MGPWPDLENNRNHSSHTLPSIVIPIIGSWGRENWVTDRRDHEKMCEGETDWSLFKQNSLIHTICYMHLQYCQANITSSVWYEGDSYLLRFMIKLNIVNNSLHHVSIFWHSQLSIMIPFSLILWILGWSFSFLDLFDHRLIDERTGFDDHFVSRGV